MQLIVDVEIECPYCFEVFPSVVDTSEGSYETIEDCSVCCRPIALTIDCEPGSVNRIETAAG